MTGPRTDSHPELPLEPDRPLHLRASSVALVFVGGAIGTLARYGLAEAVPTETGRWPWGTFTANMVGALVLGALLEALVRLGDDVGVRRRFRLLIGTGFCGGLTTYSTLAVESDLLARANDGGLAVAYLLGTVVAGAVLGWLGIVIAAGWHRRRSTAGLNTRAGA